MEFREAYWEEAQKCAGHVGSQTVCAHPKSPLEELFGFKPHVAHFRQWGCIALVFFKMSNPRILRRVATCVCSLYITWVPTSTQLQRRTLSLPMMLHLSLLLL